MKRRTFLKVLAGGSVAVAGGGGLYLVFRPDPRPPAADPEAAWLAAILPVDEPVPLDDETRAFLSFLRELWPDFLTQAPGHRASLLQALLEKEPEALQTVTHLCHLAYERHYARAPLLPGGHPRYQEPP